MPKAPSPFWFDDFIGNTVDPRYSQRCAGAGSIAIASTTGYLPRPESTFSNDGRVVLSAPGHPKGSTASLRIGAQPGASIGTPEKYAGIDLRNWDPRFNLVFEVGFFVQSMPGDRNFQSSLGFVGFNDVAGGFVLTMYADVSASTKYNPFWYLQLENNKITHNEPSTAVVKPDTYNVLRLETNFGGTEVAMYSDDIIAARYSNSAPTGALIPSQALLAELTCQSRPGSQGGAIVIDYVYITQSRSVLPGQIFRRPY